jgi:tetratricopeptide (TPR) repeat protein
MHALPWILAVSLLITATVMTAPVCAQTIEAGQGFADFLAGQGEYYRAITEYYRAYTASPDAAAKALILRRIALCYSRGEDHEGVIAFLTRYRMALTFDGSFDGSLQLLYAKSEYRLGRYSEAAGSLLKMRMTGNDTLASERAFLLGCTYAHLDDWENALTYMRDVRPADPNYGVSTKLLGSRDLLLGNPGRSPLMAGVLSAIIPGSGYIYCGRVTTGLVAFAVNGLLIWSIVDALHNGNYGIALALGFFGSGWYAGNITGSVAAAHQHNAAFRNSLLNETPPVAP